MTELEARIEQLEAVGPEWNTLSGIARAASSQIDTAKRLEARTFIFTKIAEANQDLATVVGERLVEADRELTSMSNAMATVARTYRQEEASNTKNVSGSPHIK